MLNPYPPYALPVVSVSNEGSPQTPIATPLSLANEYVEDLWVSPKMNILSRPDDQQRKAEGQTIANVFPLSSGVSPN